MIDWEASWCLRISDVGAGAYYTWLLLLILSWVLRNSTLAPLVSSPRGWTCVFENVWNFSEAISMVILYGRWRGKVMFEKFYLGAFGVLKANVSMELLQTCCGVCHTYIVISRVEYVVLHGADLLQCVSHIWGHVTGRTRCVSCCRPVHCVSHCNRLLQCVSHIWGHVTRRTRCVRCCRPVHSVSHR